MAAGLVRMAPETLALALAGGGKKGDVRAVAEIAGVMAAKRTSDLIPLCHPLALSSIKVQVAPCRPHGAGLDVAARVKTTGPTGVEMEALTAVSVACLTLYDMLKAAERGDDHRERCGCWRRPAAPPATSGARNDGLVTRNLKVEAARARMLAHVRAWAARTGEAGPPRRSAVSWPCRSRAVRDQPPFAASAMDGWAVRIGETAPADALSRGGGERGRSRGFAGAHGAGEADPHLHRCAGP